MDLGPADVRAGASLTTMAPIPACNGKKPALLIVEDNALMRMTLRRLVGMAFPFLAVHEAADGVAALELARRHQPHVVLMDIDLPDTNGISLTVQVLDMLATARVIVVTFFAGSPYEELAQAAGAFGYVVKERVHSDLVPLVVRALGDQSRGKDDADSPPPPDPADQGDRP